MDDDRQIDVELQRTELQEAIRSCSCALLIAVNPEDGLHVLYMNLSAIERRGLSHLLLDSAPRFFPMYDDEDD